MAIKNNKSPKMTPRSMVKNNNKVSKPTPKQIKNTPASSKKPQASKPQKIEELIKNEQQKKNLLSAKKNSVQIKQKNSLATPKTPAAPLKIQTPKQALHSPLFQQGPKSKNQQTNKMAQPQPQKGKGKKQLPPLKKQEEEEEDVSDEESIDLDDDMDDIDMDELDEMDELDDEEEEEDDDDDDDDDDDEEEDMEDEEAEAEDEEAGDSQKVTANQEEDQEEASEEEEDEASEEEEEEEDEEEASEEEEEEEEKEEQAKPAKKASKQDKPNEKLAQKRKWEENLEAKVVKKQKADLVDPSLAEVHKKSLFLHKIPKTTTEVEIKALSKDILSVRFPTQSRRKNNGFKFAFLEFTNEETAEKNHKLLQNKKLGALHLEVDYCGEKSAYYVQRQKTPINVNPKKLYIRGLDPTTTQQEIKAKFPFSIRVDTNKFENDLNAHISFNNIDSAAQALKSSVGLEIKGKKVLVMYAKTGKHGSKRRKRPGVVKAKADGK